MWLEEENVFFDVIIVQCGMVILEMRSKSHCTATTENRSLTG